MDNVGAEVGQKMRSAIKAKLLELNCYVDDELPDYVMVMVANRRSKVQMNEDLNLFLNTKTSAFVEWLHIVLKKLKEVTVTNPEVYKKVAKRKSLEQPDVKVKKEKLKKHSENIKKESDKHSGSSLKNEPVEDKNTEESTRNSFDISLQSESSEKDLQEIEEKIRNVKSRLGLKVDEDIDEELLKIKLEIAKSDVAQYKEDALQRQLEIEKTNNENNKSIETPDERESTPEKISYTPEKQFRKHSPITFDNEDYSRTPPRKSSILSRLGKRVSSTSESDSKRKRLDSSEYKKEDIDNSKSSSSRNTSRERYNSRDDKRYRRDRNDRDRRDRSSERRSSRNKRESLTNEEYHTRSNKNVLSRLGVMSKIHIPEKAPEEPDLDELRNRAVRSMVQVKPRQLPSAGAQPNKNLLLKAVAEANKSVSEANQRKSEDGNEHIPITRKLSHREKVKLRNLILAQVSRDDSDSNGEDEKEFEYVPKPLRKRSPHETPEYVPSSRQSIDELQEKEKPSIKNRLSAKARLESRKSPSPIIFDKISRKIANKVEGLDCLHLALPSTSMKTPEKCKYWPNCRQGDKCEFFHPSTICEVFPNCKNAENCLYLHPPCKFATACTKRDCPYSHASSSNSPVKSPVIQPQTCKYFPKCTNITCPFYHPKMCRFGKYCKNQADCPFSHLNNVNKTNLTWRSK